MKICFQWTGTPHWTGESDALVPIIVEPIVEVRFKLSFYICSSVFFQIRIPEMMFELKRGSMKEKWGLSIAFRFPDFAFSLHSTLPSATSFFCVLCREGPGGRVELGVSKVAMFSPAAKVTFREIPKDTHAFNVRLG